MFQKRKEKSSYIIVEEKSKLGNDLTFVWDSSSYLQQNFKILLHLFMQT